MARLRLATLRNTALCGAVFLLMLDRLAKQLALQVWSSDQLTLIKDWLSLSFHKNTGIAFSLNLKLDPLFFIIPVIIVLGAYLLKSWREQRYEILPLILVCAGALSNLYDRIVYGFVIDYIDLSYFTIFNLADAMITVGIVWLAIMISRSSTSSQ